MRNFGLVHVYIFSDITRPVFSCQPDLGTKDCTLNAFKLAHRCLIISLSSNQTRYQMKKITKCRKKCEKCFKKR